MPLQMEKFEMVTKIGRGACATVYLVRHKQNKRHFALKKIQLDDKRSTRTRETVLKEAKILAKLKHPNIVTYHTSFFDANEEFLCIVQDYCDGGTLYDQIQMAISNSRTFDETQAMKWFIQITMAVQYMHTNRILHRDLKAQNVFLMKNGNTVKLGDFGISKMLDTTLDVASTCVGTPCYLAPEMCEDKPYSSKADVWALGCLLYEICALKPPFDANNLISLFHKIVGGKWEPLGPPFSPELNQLLTQLIAAKPEQRPSARNVLLLPYVKQNLSRLIKELQLLTSNIDSKDTIATPVSSSREQDWSGDLSTAGAAAKELFHNAADQAIRLDIPAAKSGHTCLHCGQLFRMKVFLHKHLAAKHTVDLSHNEKADASRDEDDTYEEDFETDSSDEESNSEYADDFEECDSDEELHGIVGLAKELEGNCFICEEETVNDCEHTSVLTSHKDLFNVVHVK